jgi:hypothetical protein
MTSVLRTDLLDSDLTVNNQKVKIIVEEVMTSIAQRAVPDRTKTPGVTKDIVEVMELIRIAIKDYEAKNHTNADAQIDIVYEKPDRPFETELITMAITSRVPGAYGQGRPNESNTRNRRPLLRETVDDPDNPGYKRLILGYFYDNNLRLTCWAKTNKQANERALWLETVMEMYDPFFVYSGVNRLLYESWRTNEVIDIGSNRYYGRPIDFFVRTEKLVEVTEKTLEQIIIKLAVSKEV